MQLTHFTDLGLRVLMYLTQIDGEHTATISGIADRFGVSRHHLVKVVHFMGQQGWVLTTRGKGGGLSLARPARSYRLGLLIRELEGAQPLIDCTKPACALRSGCQLKGILDEAQAAFFKALDRRTLADTVQSPTREALIRLVRSRPRRDDAPLA